MRIIVEKRDRVSRIRRLLTTAGFLLLALAGISIIFLAKGVNPLVAYKKIFLGSFGSGYGLKETVTKAIPLLLIGSGLALAFKARFWNIGAEGQLLAGAIAASGIALKFGASLPAVIIIPLMFITGFAAGAVCGLVPAILKEKYRINEVISTLMFNYIIAEFVQYLVYGPWKGKQQLGFPYTDNFSAAAILPVLPYSRIHYPSLIIALLAVSAIHMLVTRMRFGFEIRVAGENPDAARYAGISFLRTSILIMLISGGLAGIAGVGEVAGIHHHLTYPWSISAGYGFTAIIVACLAKYNPLATVITSLFFAGILVGGDTIQTSLGLPVSTIHVFNGIILIVILISDYFIEHDIRVTRT